MRCSPFLRLLIRGAVLAPPLAAGMHTDEHGDAAAVEEVTGQVDDDHHHGDHDDDDDEHGPGPDCTAAQLRRRYWAQINQNQGSFAK